MQRVPGVPRPGRIETVDRPGGGPRSGPVNREPSPGWDAPETHSLREWGTGGTDEALKREGSAPDGVAERQDVAGAVTHKGTNGN